MTKARNLIARDLIKIAGRIETLELDGLEPFELADTGAEVKRCVDALAQVDSAIKTAIKAHGAPELRGALFVARIVESVSWRLNTKSVREEMGEDWWIKRSKQSVSRSVRYGV